MPLPGVYFLLSKVTAPSADDEYWRGVEVVVIAAYHPFTIPLLTHGMELFTKVGFPLLPITVKGGVVGIPSNSCM
ncbi:hypothetical protein [Rufibacter radiotolerans]|uniref:hypothetical protein n=1 Tax=Rufibacter radiotolerans TaxID=1379910 RepID=UPI000AD13420|nr:hypothetical protein [Rufibacter radiotolerans]